MWKVKCEVEGGECEGGGRGSVRVWKRESVRRWKWEGVEGGRRSVELVLTRLGQLD